MGVVINFELHCNCGDAYNIIHGILLLIRMAGICSRANEWFTLTRKFIFKGT